MRLAGNGAAVCAAAGARNRARVRLQYRFISSLP
jgi:hypothetical protein